MGGVSGTYSGGTNYNPNAFMTYTQNAINQQWVYIQQIQNQLQPVQMQPFTGTAVYDPDYKGYIKVDKGSPDKAKFVIFYAVEKKDPMIFCKTRVEVKKELQKLVKRREVDPASIRVFALTGFVVQKKKPGKLVTIVLKTGKKVKGFLVEK